MAWIIFYNRIGHDDFSDQQTALSAEKPECPEPPYTGISGSWQSSCTPWTIYRCSDTFLSSVSFLAARHISSFPIGWVCFSFRSVPCFVRSFVGVLWSRWPDGLLRPSRRRSAIRQQDIATAGFRRSTRDESARTPDRGNLSTLGCAAPGTK